MSDNSGLSFVGNSNSLAGAKTIFNDAVEVGERVIEPVTLDTQVANIPGVDEETVVDYSKYKVFMTGQGLYYAALDRINPGDSMLPFASPTMLATLIHASKTGTMVHKSVVNEAAAQEGNGAGSQYTNTGIVI